MIAIVSPGLLTTVQDRGRWGYQAYGVPVAGAMDRYAYATANLLVGNVADAAVLEMTLVGATYRFAQSAWVAVAGADMQGTLDGKKIVHWSAFYVPGGSELAFGFAEQGCRTYLAVRGGIDVPPVLGSRSTYTRGRIGGFAGRALQGGDALQLLPEAGAGAVFPRSLPAAWIPDYSGTATIRVLLGPQEDCFSAAGIDTLFNGEYTISNEADRMGYRMEGAKIEHLGKADIVSDALCQGAIQVPAHGMPIVMMADRQTTGGYAKIGTVIGPDLARLAQAKAGDAVRFIRCTDEQAVAALREERECYGQMAAWAAADPVWATEGKGYTIRVNGVAYAVTVEEVQ